MKRIIQENSKNFPYIKSYKLFIVFALMLVLMAGFAYGAECPSDQFQCPEGTCVTTVHDCDIESIIKSNLDKVDVSDMPGPMRFILGKPRVNIQIEGSDALYGFYLQDDKPVYVSGGLDDPHYLVEVSEKAIIEASKADDVSDKIGELFKQSEIKVTGRRLMSKVKLGVATMFMEWFG